MKEAEAKVQVKFQLLGSDRVRSWDQKFKWGLASQIVSNLVFQLDGDGLSQD